MSLFRSTLRHGRVAYGASNPKAVVRHNRNPTGRDFVVGDIHGMFRHLEALLDDLEFDPRRDRLFSVGDLVDRGPQSRDALQWLEKPWFAACRGNHEQFVIDSTDAQEQEFWTTHNGGDWWLELSEPEQRRFRGVLRELPLALEVETRAGLVGIVHADIPPGLSWEEFCDLLRQGVHDVIMYSLFARHRVQGGVPMPPVSGGVDRIYCGHTPVRQVVTVGNVHFIDTAAVYVQEDYQDARLTVVEIHPEAHREYEIHTDRPV